MVMRRRWLPGTPVHGGRWQKCRSYLQSQEVMDCYPEFQSATMIPDEADVLGTEHSKVLKQEMKEQSRLELILADGDHKLVDEYCRIAEPLWERVKKQIKGSRACANIVETMNAYSLDVSQPMVKGVLFKLLRNDKYVVGWKLVNYMARSGRFVKDDTTHLFQIAFAALADRDRAADNVFEHLPREHRNQKAFHVFLAGGALRRTNRVRMERLFSELKSRKWYTSPVALNQMLLLYQQPDLRSRVPVLFEEAKMAGVSPDVSSYNICMGCHCMDKNVIDMEKVLEALKSDPGVEADESTHIILACGYIAAGCFDKAGKTLVELEEKLERGVLRRRQATYNKLLRLYGDTKDGEGVENVWGILTGRPRPLKAVETYSFGIQALGKAVGVRRAEEVFAAADGLRDTKQVISMMSLYCSHGYMDKAKELFQHLPRKRMKHRLVLYRHLIHGYLRDAQPKKALQVFNLGCTILRHRCQCRSWEKVVFAVVDHFASRGDVKIIQRMFETNPELKRLCQDMRLYRVVLKAYLNQRAPVKQFFEWTETMGFAMDSETRQLMFTLKKKNKLYS